MKPGEARCGDHVRKGDAEMVVVAYDSASRLHCRTADGKTEVLWPEEVMFVPPPKLVVPVQQGPREFIGNEHP